VVRLALLTGFLGAGKTTTMLAAARALSAAGGRVAVVTNDQGADLVDSALARTTLPLVGEVTGGCFCCRFDDLVTTLDGLLGRADLDVVLAEAVGSCTDLQATVVRPLRRLHGSRLAVAPLTTVVDPARLAALEWRPDSLPAGAGERADLAYLFDRQLAEADVIAVNKADGYPPEHLGQVAAALAGRYPHARVIRYSATTGAGLDGLVDAWQAAPPAERDVPVDYDRYAAAEAALAWLNRTVRVSAAEGFSPGSWAESVLADITRRCARAGCFIGHVKLSVDAGGTLLRLSVTAAGEQPAGEQPAGDAPAGGSRPPSWAPAATVMLNARVAADPVALDALVDAALAGADRSHRTRSQAARSPAFRPSYPRPTHRLPALP
jgi:Ni2+-binding GTPase involved in maturation of urease and hydrogenase